MMISDDLKMYLQERRRALLYEIEGIETLIGVTENRRRRAERREVLQDTGVLDGPRVVADGAQAMRRG